MESLRDLFIMAALKGIESQGHILSRNCSIKELRPGYILAEVGFFDVNERGFFNRDPMHGGMEIKDSASFDNFQDAAAWAFDAMERIGKDELNRPELRF